MAGDEVELACSLTRTGRADLFLLLTSEELHAGKDDALCERLFAAESNSHYRPVADRQPRGSDL
jgi:hypothetical protein